MNVQLTEVTQHDVVAIASLDRIRSRTTQYDVVSGTSRHYVVAVVGGIASDNLRQYTHQIKDNVAEVAKDDIVSAGRNHDVAQFTSDDDVVAIAAIDGVDAAVNVIDRLHRTQCSGGIDVNFATVTDDAVIAASGVDCVGRCSGNNNIIATAGADIVTITIDKVLRNQLQQLTESVERREAVVAEHHVVSVDDDNTVFAGTTDHDVIAGTAGDGVVAGIAGIERLQTCDNSGRCEDRLAMVAHDQVVTFAGIDDVVSGAAKDNIVGGNQINDVTGSGCWSLRVQLQQLTRCVEFCSSRIAGNDE